MKDSFISRIIGIGLLLISQTASAAVLMQTEASSNDYAVDVTLNFDGPISEKDVKIEFINQTVQLEIPNVAVPNGKLLKRLQSEKVKSVFSYQLNKDVMRTRVIYEKPIQANMFEGFVYVKSEGNNLRIRIEDPQSKMSAAVTKKVRPMIVPPLDLNSELEPKDQSPLDQDTSAAAVLEKEFLAKIEKFEGSPSAAVKKPKKTKPVQVQKVVEPSGPEVATKSADYDESKIPVNFDQKKQATNTESPWVRMIISLFVIIAIGLGAVIFTKKFSSSSSKIGGNIKIQTVSQQSLGPKKSLAVIRVAGEDILIGITDYNISMIKSLSFLDDEIEQQVPIHFVSELNRVTDDFLDSGRAPKLKQDPKPRPAAAASGQDDQYSFANIKDIVSDKLKEMRPL